MIIAAVVISVLSVAVSAYSVIVTRRAAKARRETERLRTAPVIEFSGTLTPEAEAAWHRRMRRVAGHSDWWQS